MGRVNLDILYFFFFIEICFFFYRIKFLVKIGVVFLILFEKLVGCVWVVFFKLCFVKYFCFMKIFIRVFIKGILWLNVFEKYYLFCVFFGALSCKFVYEGFCEDAF